MVRVGVSQCLNGGWRNRQGTKIEHPEKFGICYGILLMDMTAGFKRYCLLGLRDGLPAFHVAPLLFFVMFHVLCTFTATLTYSYHFQQLLLFLIFSLRIHSMYLGEL